MQILDIHGRGDNYYKATSYTDSGEPMSTFVMFTGDGQRARDAYDLCKARAIVARLKRFTISVWRRVPGVPGPEEEYAIDHVPQLRGMYEEVRAYTIRSEPRTSLRFSVRAA